MAFGQNIGTPSIFQPESQYMSDLQNSNSQVAMATNAARANMSSGLFGGLGTAIGGIFGGPLGATLGGVAGSGRRG